MRWKFEAVEAGGALHACLVNSFVILSRKVLRVYSHKSASMEDSSGVNLWETLPDECKSMILSRLSNREAARIARVSKEFDEVVKNIRDSVQLLVLPPDLSPAALQSFVCTSSNSLIVHILNLYLNIKYLRSCIT